MSTTAKNASVENENSVYTGKVIAVRSADRFGVRRVSVTVDIKFPGLDDKGAEIETDTFTIDSGQILHCECNEPLLEIVKYKALERPINKAVIAGLMNGGVIEFTRELKTPEDIRQNGEHYTSTQYVTRIVKMTCNISEVIKPFLINDIQNNLFEKEQAKPSVSSIFATAGATLSL